MKKEPWDISSEKAKELKIEDFGSLEEVIEMSKVSRIVKNREETVNILKYIAKNGKLKSKSGLIASLSNKSIKEITSGRVIIKSFDINAHWLAAANIDKLFPNAIEPWEFELDPNKNNEHLNDRKYLFSPLEYEGFIFPVKITVKEYKQEGDEKRIYSIEAINVDLWTKK